MGACPCICIHGHVHKCVCVPYMEAYACICIHVHVYKCVCVCMYVTHLFFLQTMLNINSTTAITSPTPVSKPIMIISGRETVRYVLKLLLGGSVEPISKRKCKYSYREFLKRGGMASFPLPAMCTKTCKYICGIQCTSPLETCWTKAALSDEGLP